MWSNLASTIYLRTYSRNDNSIRENWDSTTDRVIEGNTRNHKVSQHERDMLKYFMMSRKASPAGRGLWFSGTKSHSLLGGVAQNNCYYVECSKWETIPLAMDLLMLGGGVGMSVEQQFIQQLPTVKPAKITHNPNKDAYFIVPDSREGWCGLIAKMFKAYFKSGKCFDYSTSCVRGANEPIKGFGGVSSGPIPLIKCVEKISTILNARVGHKVRPIDMADILCCVGEMVVSGNVRRSAILIMCDPWDKEMLRCKRWDLGVQPSFRSFANYTVVADDVEDLHPEFWKTYEVGEPFGLFNRKNARKYGRIGEVRPDNCAGLNPCGEATLHNYEPCNLTELMLHRLDSVEETINAAKLMYRYSKRVTCETYHHPQIDRIVKENRRVGVGITGCLRSPLFKPDVLDEVYKAIQIEDEVYSKELGIPKSIKTTLVKPSGTLSKLMDADGYEGIHPAYSRYFIQRIRFAANDPLIPLLAAAGHHIEPIKNSDGTINSDTLVVDYYLRTPDGYPVADEDWGTWKQLDVLKMVQKYWADQAASVTIYYKREEIAKVKEWLYNNYNNIKSISFLCHSEHGFKQAPKEAITEQQYEELSKKVRPIDLSKLNDSSSYDIDNQECQNGSCPIR